MKQEDIPFEESLSSDWGHDLSMVEVPIGNRPLFYLGIGISIIAVAVLFQVLRLNLFQGGYYAARADGNAAQYEETPAPRGIIYDREGTPLVDNAADFTATLDARRFLSDPSIQADTVAAAGSVFGMSSDTLWSMLKASQNQDFTTPVVLSDDLTQGQLVNLKALGLPTIQIASSFKRTYPQGPVFSSVIGYLGRVTQNDLERDPNLKSQDLIGKAGVEQFYNDLLAGNPGVKIEFRNAQGQLLSESQQSAPVIGQSLHLTLDGGLQSYLYTRLANGLRSLGRQIGAGLAIDPQTGQVLSLVNLPGFDNNVFSNPASNTAEIQGLLTSNERPLFNRIVSGFYNPGSTIKPLDGVAILKEGIVSAQRQIFSPGYILVPNPYNSSTPTRYLDWRYQGNVDLSSALAQSSDVYFYVTVGGSPAMTTPPINDASDYGVGGLGISKLFNWWQTFGLGKPTGIDLPNEAEGFLPTPQWKEQRDKTPWLLGDTYNVAIGQGTLLLTPLQLLSYIDAIANGGKIYKPFLNASSTPSVSEDLTYLLPQIQEVQQGMREAVTSPQGTAFTLSGLPMDVCAKTGSAQVQNNTQENALFVGYAPCNDPKIALLILIENSKEGSLNAVPIAKDVLNWYYLNRIAGNGTKIVTTTATSSMTTAGQ